jgi:hypothetical protein
MLISLNKLKWFIIFKCTLFWKLDTIYRYLIFFYIKYQKYLSHLANTWNSEIHLNKEMVNLYVLEKWAKSNEFFDLLSFNESKEAKYMLYNGRIVWVLNVFNYTFSHLWVNIFFTLNKQKSEQKIIKPKPKVFKVTLKKSHKQFFSLKLSKSKNSFDLEWKMFKF